MADPLILLGQIGRAHGVKGEVRIKSFTEDPLAIADYGPLTTDGGAELEIIEVRPSKEVVVARLKGVTRREAAEALNGTKLYVPRDRLPDDLEEDEDGESFYHADLIGLEAVSASGDLVGSVVAVFDFGAGDLLEIAKPGKKGGDLLPFTPDFVPEVQLEAGRIIVDLPEDFNEPPPPKPKKQGKRSEGKPKGEQAES